LLINQGQAQNFSAAFEGMSVAIMSSIFSTLSVIDILKEKHDLLGLTYCTSSDALVI